MHLPGEKRAIRQTLEYAEQYGYGNLINLLKMAWVVKLLETYPEMTVETAARGAGFVQESKTQDRDKVISDIKRILKERSDNGD